MACTLRIPNVSMLILSMVATLLLAVPSTTHASQAATCMGFEATIQGSSGNDTLEGTPGDDVIIGLAGRDVIYGYGGDDIICAGGGRDRVYGGPGQDIIFGQGSNDTLRGGKDDDILKGGAGNDKLFGNGGSDVLKGHRGADVCVGEREYGCEMDDRGPRPEEEWRKLVKRYFPEAEVRNALDIIDCESNGDPFAVGSSSIPSITFLGLFQHHSTYWPQRAINIGFRGETAFHPEANISAAASLWEKSGWSPWPWCKRFHGL